MISVPEILTEVVGQSLVVAFVIFLRMAAFFALLPAFGERTVSVRVKLALSIAMTVIVAPQIQMDSDQFSLPSIIFTEVVTGAIFGIGMRLMLMALQMAGSIAAQSTSLAQLLGGNSVEPLPALGHVLVISGLALAVMSGIHIRAAVFFISTYEIVPFGQIASPNLYSQWGVDRIAKAFSLAFSLAGPFVVLSVIYNLALGAINRAMPQLMVAFVGAPLITGGALAMLLFAAPFMISVWMDVFKDFLSDPFAMR